MQCPECNEIHWKYNFLRHYDDQHGDIQVPLELFAIGENEREMLKAKLKNKGKRKYVAVEKDNRESRKIQQTGEKRQKWISRRAAGNDD